MGWYQGTDTRLHTRRETQWNCLTLIILCPFQVFFSGIEKLSIFLAIKNIFSIGEISTYDLVVTTSISCSPPIHLSWSRLSPAYHWPGCIFIICIQHSLLTPDLRMISWMDRLAMPVWFMPAYCDSLHRDLRGKYIGRSPISPTRAGVIAVNFGHLWSLLW